MNVQEFFEAFKKGQRHFSNLHFEYDKGFQGQNLKGVIFDSCFLYIDLRNSNLKGAKFIDCNLKELDLRESNLCDGLMTKCLIESTLFRGAEITNFVFKENYYYGHILNQENLHKLIEIEAKED